MALLSLFYLVAGIPAVSAQRNNNNGGATHAEAQAHPLRYLEPTEDQWSSSAKAKAENQDT